MQRAEKEAVVEKLGSKLKGSKIAVVAEYTGLKVSEVTALRKALNKTQGEFHVVKNRLAKLAVQGTAMEVISPYLKGSTALVYGSGDPVMITKAFAKAAEGLEPLKIKGGCLDGKMLKAADVAALAKLPSKEELYAKLLRTLSAPASNLVRVLNALPQQVVTVLDAISKKS